MEVKLTLKMKSVNEILKNHRLEKGGMAQQFLDREILTRLDPYIPLDSGALKRSGIQNTVIGSGVIKYSVPYAKAVYYGKTGGGKDMKFNGAPKRGPFFLERMMADNRKEIAAALSVVIGGTAV